MPTPAQLIEQLDALWRKLLSTSKSGTWYVGHPGAPGRWSEAEKLKDELRADLGEPPPPVVSVSIDASGAPVLRAVTSPEGSGVSYSWLKADRYGQNAVTIAGQTGDSLTVLQSEIDAGNASWAANVDGTLSDFWLAQTKPTTGAVVYKKDWEDGLIDSEGWGQQSAASLCGGALPCFAGGIGRGVITVETATPPGPDRGSKYGKFRLPASAGTDSRFNSPPRIQCEMLHQRKPDMGVDDYYAQAIAFSTGFTSPYDAGCAICQLNYPGFPPMGLGAANNYTTGVGPLSVYAYCLSGQYVSAISAEDYSGGPRGAGYAARGRFAGIPGPYYMIEPGSLVFNQWYECIIHSRWSVDYDGIFEGWIRPRGTQTWTQKFSHGPWDANFCTFPFDDTHVASTGWERVNIRNNVQTTNDKFGAYQGTVNADRTVYQDTFARCTTFDAAAAQFG